MALELVWQDVIMRVDDDVLEVFTAGSAGHRTPLRWLVVRAEPRRDNRVQVTVGAKSFQQVTQNVEVPLYAWGKLDGAYQGPVFPLGADEELAFRAFFTKAAEICGRSVGQIGASGM
jgi:hypothetical protein